MTGACARAALLVGRAARGGGRILARPAGALGGLVSPQAGELLQGEHRLHGHVEVPGDAQRQVEQGDVLAVDRKSVV